MKRAVTSRLLALTCMVSLLAPAAAHACSVPVFRYALERWQADAFRAIVLHRGPLSAGDEAAVALLDGSGLPDDRAAPNIRVQTLDLAGTNGNPLAVDFQDEVKKGLPRVLLRYSPVPGEDDTEAGLAGYCPAAPGAPMGRAPLAWAGPLEPAAIRSLLQSPGRIELAKRLLRGDSIVWILVESGNKDRDAAAAALLETELRKQEKAAAEAPAKPEADESVAAVTVVDPVPVVFSVLRLSRQDVAEQAFLSMLLNTEADLGKYADQPLVFPVFGRGRVLYALAGRGITAGHIAEACDYLTGPCSCEVKDENPGTDLLLGADWDQIADGRRLSDDPLPPLTGLSPDFLTAGTNSAAVPAAASADADGTVLADSRQILRNAALTLGGMALGIGLLGFLLVHRQGRGGRQP